MFSLILVRKCLQTNNKFEPLQHHSLVAVVKIMWKINKMLVEITKNYKTKIFKILLTGVSLVTLFSSTITSCFFSDRFEILLNRLIFVAWISIVHALNIDFTLIDLVIWFSRFNQKTYNLKFPVNAQNT